MKIAASNLSLPAFDHLHLLPPLRALGITGLEVIPARTWTDLGGELTVRQVGAYRYAPSRPDLRSSDWMACWPTGRIWVCSRASRPPPAPPTIWSICRRSAGISADGP